MFVFAFNFATGPAGPARPKGDTGSPGQQGIQGIQGPQGPAGHITIYNIPYGHDGRTIDTAPGDCQIGSPFIGSCNAGPFDIGAAENGIMPLIYIVSTFCESSQIKCRILSNSDYEPQSISNSTNRSIHSCYTICRCSYRGSDSHTSKCASLLSDQTA